MLFSDITIPAPSVYIKKELLGEYARLYKGIRDREDTVSWRTLIVSLKKILGSGSPEFKPLSKKTSLKAKKLTRFLIQGTHFLNLYSEIIYALGYKTKNSKEKLDYLLFNGRHNLEPLLWSLADYLKSKNKKVAVINPVGHYSDGQTRVVGPAKLFKSVDHLVILSSTQTKQKGSVSVLSNVVRLIRNPEYAGKVKYVDVIIPMFGGSRGHRISQTAESGFEVLEAAFNAKLLCLPAKDLLEELRKEIVQKKIKLPTIRFYSVDIHNSIYPFKIFDEEGFPFFSVDPSKNFSDEIISLLKKKQPKKYDLKVVACDKGAIVRTQNLAQLLLAKRSFIKKLDVVCLEKYRLDAGVTANVKIGKIERWKRNGDTIKKYSLKTPTSPNYKKQVFVYFDDMIDSGGTAENDFKFINSLYPNTALKIFAATHPIFSRGLGALKRIGADYYLIGNSLNQDHLEEERGVVIVDLASSIAKHIL